MHDLGYLLHRAQTGDQHAYGEIVGHFQNMAVGYAYSILGDWYMAEDASQEAFVEAWRFLGKVYGPASFPGWFRSIVFKCCHRGIRGKHLKTVPLEQAMDVATAERNPAEQIDDQERRALIHRAMQGLTEKERQVTLLFYMTEHSYHEVADFLNIPVNTVKSRLYSAREKLRERMIDTMKDHLHEQAPSRNQTFTQKVLDQVYPVPGDSTVIGCLHPILKAAGAETSMAYLMGTLGHAFSFIMQKDGGEVWQQGALDWQLFWERLYDLGIKTKEFDAILKGTKPAPSEETLKALKKQTWEVVKASVDKGIPAMAWQPMTQAQRDKGIGAYEWGLLVGYDEQQKTYAIRHPRDNTAYDVPYDGFGYTDPINWYYVIVVDGLNSVDRHQVALQSLKDAVAFAEGDRYDMGKICYPTDAMGLAAYELWTDSLQSDAVNLHFAASHANTLGMLRQHAAEYLNEIGDLFEKDTSRTLQTATHAYKEEVSATKNLTEICQHAAQDGFNAAQRKKATDYLQRALEAERKAIEAIKAVLSAG